MSQSPPCVQSPARATAGPRANARCDVLVAGAGVFGLWCAKVAIERGLSVMVVDPRGPASGASGGVLGALTAHTPDRWSEKKQFQLSALLELPARVAALEAETGRSAGYRRCGRLMPIRSAAFRRQVEARQAGAEAHWATADPALIYAAESAASHEAWLDPAQAPEGVVWDSLAARVSPSAYMDALWTWIAARAETRIGAGYARWDDAAVLDDGSRVAAGAVVLAAGVDTFPVLDGLLGRSLGGGVKGQAALLRPSPEARAGVDPPIRPLIYDDGVYVVPHEDGLVAVGSSSAKTWDAPDTVDPTDNAFLHRARALCPILERAEIVRWWAGVRPRCRLRDPILGRLPIGSPLFVATGGYKISFGIAHRAARVVIDAVEERADAIPVPTSFTVAHHLDPSAR